MGYAPKKKVVAQTAKPAPLKVRTNKGMQEPTKAPVTGVTVNGALLQGVNKTPVPSLTKKKKIGIK